jgi:hypothetical protein
MNVYRVIDIVVYGRECEAAFFVSDHEVSVMTQKGQRSVPLRGFEPEELARIVAIDLLTKAPAGHTA